MIVRRRPSLAGPNVAKIRRPLWRPGRRPKIWTAELAGQNIDGQPNLKRTATLAVRQNQRKFFSLIWFDRIFRHPSLIWPANFAVQIFGRRKKTRKYFVLFFYSKLNTGLAVKVAVRLYNRPSRRSCSRFKKFLAASMANVVDKSVKLSKKPFDETLLNLKLQQD
ncbi:hypothetical protein BpHYR1_042401 [Brachionus plicatilis]|uniref:Uncharacterized protein n=1 Tax=Brachionus plicatilis TaxID=10195 RepID=A0A3M7RJ28_BRAPC|nr:hypothetical protein BpHYR1_042401 [Brachionus plicatilis]